MSLKAAIQILEVTHKIKLLFRIYSSVLGRWCGISLNWLGYWQIVSFCPWGSASLWEHVKNYVIGKRRKPWILEQFKLSKNNQLLLVGVWYERMWSSSTCSIMDSFYICYCWTMLKTYQQLSCYLYIFSYVTRVCYCCNWTFLLWSICAFICVCT